MHYVPKGKEPAGLADIRAKYTQRWVDYYKHNLGKEPTDSHWRRFAEALGEEFHGLCGYCEQGCKGEVEHFRPKTKSPDKVYRWNNWVLACHDCNSAKGEKWPKTGTIEHVHDEIKNGLGGGQLPSAKFGANAAWFRIACIAYNIVVAVKHAWPDETLHNAKAKAKRVRFVLINVTGRFSRDRRKITLHLSATAEWIKWFVKLFVRFPLPTQPTG